MHIYLLKQPSNKNETTLLTQMRKERVLTFIEQEIYDCIIQIETVFNYT